MRYSRLKRSRSRRRYVLVFVVFFLLLGAVYFLSAGAIGRYISGIIAPILAGEKNLNEAEGDISSVEEYDQNDREEVELTLPKSENEEEGISQEENNGRINENIRVEPKSYYALQLGAFNGIENAKLLAEDIKQKGGAGYIIEDEYFRVLAMAYDTKVDAELVKNQLIEQGVESQIYELVCVGVNMEVTATKEKIESIKSSFNVWIEEISVLESTIKELDTDKITNEISINRLREIREELVYYYERIGEYKEANEGNKILEGLYMLYQSQINSIDELLENNMTDGVVISSNLKYNYINMIYKFNKYIEEITKG